jgi:hypothetical protein
MTDVGRQIGRVVLGFLVLASATGPALANSAGGAHGAGGHDDSGVDFGGFYSGADTRARRSAGAGSGLARVSRYGGPLSPFPCPYPSLFVADDESATSR